MRRDSYRGRVAAARLRVEIEGEPLVLRSAIHSCLDGDPRFDIAMAGAHDDSVSAHAPHANLAAVAHAVPRAVVTAVEHGPLRVQLVLDQGNRSIPFHGIRRLADAIARAVDACNPWTSETAEIRHA